MSRLELDPGMQRVVKFFIGLRNARLRAALAGVGFRQEDADEGRDLLDTVMDERVHEENEDVAELSNVHEAARAALFDWYWMWSDLARVLLEGDRALLRAAGLEPSPKRRRR